jgi:hypothetical protein
MEYSATGFPSPIDNDSVKKSEAYGLRVAKAAWAPFDLSNTYIIQRNLRFVENDLFFQGNQPLAPYLKLLDTDGKDSFLNIDFYPVPIVKKYGKIVINGYMNVEERVSATSMNKLVKERKERKRLDAEFRMNEAPFIEGLQEQAGVEFEDPKAFTPETEEELDVWAEMNDKEREELLMQEALGFSFEQNNILDNLKKEVLTDWFKKSLAATYTYLDENGKIIVKRIRPEYFIYGHSDRDDLSDCQYYGHYEMMTITEARVRFGTDEKFLYSIAKSMGGIFGNSAVNYEWNNGWYSAAVRPYDDFVVKVMHVWYKVAKDINYVSGTTKRGRRTFDLVPNGANPTNPNKKAGSKKIYTAYEGWWYVGTDTMAEWGESKNQIRRNPNLEDVWSPYVAYMWDNDGNMRPTSKVDNIKAEVRGMDLAKIKIQQIIAKAAPDGYFIDVDGLHDIELTKGAGVVSPMKLVGIAQQTGNVYYRSKDMGGDPNAARKPIEPNQTTFGSKLNELIGIYNFHLNNIRDFLGVNEMREGSAVNPKMGLGVAQEQLAASNNATSDGYAGWLSIGSRISRNVGQLIWDSLKYGSDYEGYRKFLGEQNVEFIKNAKEITDSNYDLKMEVVSTPAEKERLQKFIETALANQLIEMEDAIFIENIDDVKLAYRYMVVVQKKRRKEKMEEAQANSEQNAQIQQASAASKAQADTQVAQAKTKGEVMVVATKNSGDLELEKRKFLYDIQLEAFKLGKPLPPEIEEQIAQLAQDEQLQKQMQEELINNQYGTESESEPESGAEQPIAEPVQ